MAYKISSVLNRKTKDVKKISKTKIAVTYATALLDAALQKKNAAKVFADVLALREAASKDAEFAKYMVCPLWKDEDKLSVLTQVAKKLKLSDETLRCLDVIYQNCRFGDLLPILDEFVHLYYRHNNVAEVEVESVKKLSSAQDKKLVGVLEKLLGQKVTVAYKICPELIGGLKVRFGSEMFDDTVAAKLSRLEIMMKGEE